MVPAFSLVELLVVVSVIALLVALLLPSTSKARYQAKVTVCASQLRQTASGMLAYTSDHVAWYPIGAHPRIWTTVLNNGNNAPVEDDIKPLVQRYLGNNLGVLLCPLVSERFGGKIAGYEVSYSLYPGSFGRGVMTGLSGGAYQVTQDSLDHSKIKKKLDQSFNFNIFGQPSQKFNLIASDFTINFTTFHPYGYILNHMNPSTQYIIGPSHPQAWGTQTGSGGSNYAREDGSVASYANISPQTWNTVLFNGFGSPPLCIPKAEALR